MRRKRKCSSEGSETLQGTEIATIMYVRTNVAAGAEYWQTKKTDPKIYFGKIVIKSGSLALALALG